MQQPGPFLDQRHSLRLESGRGLELSGQYIWLPGKIRGFEFRFSQEYFNYLTLIVAFCFSFRHVQTTGESSFFFLLIASSYKLGSPFCPTQLCFIHIINVCHASNMNGGDNPEFLCDVPSLQEMLCRVLRLTVKLDALFYCHLYVEWKGINLF